MKSLVGRRFGRLVVTERSSRKGTNAKLLCQCDCGAFKEVGASNLVSGRTVSCGCRIRETQIAAGDRTRTHGRSNTREYTIWNHIIQRCLNPKSPHFRKYGAKGITMSNRWRESFEAFFGDMGPCPSGRHSIDRIDNSRGYEPGNCRWATATEQARNTSQVRLVAMDGVVRCLSEWAEFAGMSQQTLRHRIKRGWPFDKAIKTPTKRQAAITT